MVLEKTENSTQIISLDDFLEIIGNPTRRIILAKLTKVPLGASELATLFGIRISRQAVHSQLKYLSDLGIVESYNADPRNKKYRIKKNLSLKVDIAPDYYNVSYSTREIERDSKPQRLDYQNFYEKLKKPNEKLNFLGKQIAEIEREIRSLEEKRAQMIKDKQCLISELKTLMNLKFKDRLFAEQENKEMEILYTLLYNPLKFFTNKRLNIEKLIDEMVFSRVGGIERKTERLMINELLKHMSEFLDILYEDEDKFIFDI